ncbi:MAG: phosphoglycolate phosphatase [Rhodobacterales bacterium]|nr:phosphoglycolate phosphatase [Rhodobacterales bacterium]
MTDSSPAAATAPESPLKAVVFDLDGTLIHSAPDLQLAVNRLLAEEGRPDLDLMAVTLMIGDGARKLVERAFEATGEPAPDADLDALTDRFLGHYEGKAADNTRPFPDTEATLEALRAAGLRLGVCTNKPHAATVEILEALGLAGYFDAVVGGDSLDGVRKPDPRHLMAVVSALGAGPGEAVMVGDNANDVAAARAAGLPVYVMSYGYTRIPSAELGADGVLDGFAQIPGAIGVARGAP